MKLNRVTSTAAVLFVLAATVPVYGQHEETQKKEEKQEKPQAQHSPEARQDNQRPQVQARPQQAQQPRPEAQHTQQAQQPRPEAQHTQQAQQPRPEAQHAQQAAPQKPSPVGESRQQQRVQPAAQQGRQEPQRTQQQAQTWQQQKGWAQHGGGSVGHATFAQSRSVNWSSDHRTWAQRGGYGGYYIPQARFSVSFGTGHSFRLGGQPNMYMGYPQFAYGGFSFLMVDPWPSDWPGDWYSADDVYIDYDDGYYLYNRRFPQERLAITIALD